MRIAYTTRAESAGEDDMQENKDGRGEHRTMVLADGTQVQVREIEPGDAPALQRLVGRLSEQSIYLRFFGPMNELSDKKAKHFAEVDGEDQYALVALDPQDDGEIVAVARYDREGGTDRAEAWAWGSPTPSSRPPARGASKTSKPSSYPRTEV